MERIKEQYEYFELKITYLEGQDVLTISGESGYGDGWVKDPFTEN